MDFVMSKVAMSICALLVVGVLSGCLDPANFVDPGQELDDLVRRFCGLVDRAALSGSSCSVAWEVPSLSGGGDVTLLIHRGLVAAQGGGEASVGQPVSGVHTWHNTGAAINASGLRLLDSAAEGLGACSGERILLTTELVLLENEPAYLAFVKRAG
jgi:hypothetical protein